MASPSSQTVASRVSDLMSRTGVSTKALADETGIPRMTLARRLTGHSAFTIDELDIIARHFDTTLGLLVADEDAA